MEAKRDTRSEYQEARKAERLAAAARGDLAWMDAEEAAEYLGENPSRFRAAAARKEFSRYKDIGGYKYSREDLDRWRRERIS